MREIIFSEEMLNHELSGLESMVNLYWGGKASNMVEVVVRAKAMLEASEWGEKANRRHKLNNPQR